MMIFKTNIMTREEFAERWQHQYAIKVVGASKPSPWFCGMGPLGVEG